MGDVEPKRLRLHRIVTSKPDLRLDVQVDASGVLTLKDKKYKVSLDERVEYGKALIERISNELESNYEMYKGAADILERILHDQIGLLIPNSRKKELIATISTIVGCVVALLIALI